MIVNNNSAEKATVKENQGGDGIKQFIVSIGANDIATGGPMAGAMERVYNLRRAGRVL